MGDVDIRHGPQKTLPVAGHSVLTPVDVGAAMPAKVTDDATGYREVDRWPGGVGWIAHPEETMRRASHALATDDGVYVVDPVDAPGVDDLLAEVGEVAGVVVLSNFHRRDAAAVAGRHGVAVHVPETMTDLAGDLPAPVELVEPGATLGGYELVPVDVGTPVGPDWHEYALYDGETLVVGESVGCAPYMRVGDERLGVMTLRRLDPPTEALADLEPDRVLSGHGSGVLEDGDEALAEALDGARRRLPRALVENGLSQVRTVLAAMRS